jgi:hypothetical protein
LLFPPEEFHLLKLKPGAAVVQGEQAIIVYLGVVEMQVVVVVVVLMQLKLLAV